MSYFGKVGEYAKEDTFQLFSDAIDTIDDEFGKDYAKNHPQLLGDVMKVHAKLLWFNFKTINEDFPEEGEERKPNKTIINDLKKTINEDIKECK